MISWLPSLIGTALALTGAEILKQIGVRATQRYAPPVVAAGLVLLDKLLPQIVAQGLTADQVEDRLRQHLGELTGADWSEIRRRFDPAVFLERQQKARKALDRLPSG